MSNVHFNTTTCPFCGADCRNHPSLIAHMLVCALRPKRRVNWNSGKLVTAIATGALALSLLTTSPTKAQNVQPVPTPSISTPPDVAHVVYLPIVASDYVEGQPGGGPVHPSASGDVSWCPHCNPHPSYDGHGGHGSFGGK